MTRHHDPSLGEREDAPRLGVARSAKHFDAHGTMATTTTTMTMTRTKSASMVVNMLRTALYTVTYCRGT